jgi:hypothetical protein
MGLNADQIIGLCFLCGFVGLLSILAIFKFGSKSLDRELYHRLIDFREYIEFLDKQKIRSNIPKYLSEITQWWLDKRNEFWASFGQMIIAAVIITIISILLISKTISPEAGLPILSAIASFAIAKGAGSSSRHDGGSDNEKRE